MQQARVAVGWNLILRLLKLRASRLLWVLGVADIVKLNIQLTILNITHMVMVGLAAVGEDVPQVAAAADSRAALPIHEISTTTSTATVAIHTSAIS